MENKISLDESLDRFDKLLDKAKHVVIERLSHLDSGKVFVGLSEGHIKKWFDEPLPEYGIDSEKLIADVKEKVIDTATLNAGPNFYAYISSGGTQISIISELLATTINQNAGKWHSAPSINEIEKRVITWTSEFIGYEKEKAGLMLSGGSSSNLLCLTVARNICFEKYDIKKKGLFNSKPFIVYGSKETHNSIDKAIETLGIGSDNYRKIQTNQDGTINIERLENHIIKDIDNGFLPFCVIGNAGTVNTGAIDSLDKIADIAIKYNLWFHIDGAYGAIANSLDDLKPKFRGLNRSDSIAIDFHKWLYQPIAAGCALLSNWNYLHKSFFKDADYLSSKAEPKRLDFKDYGFQLSRNAKALKVWMTFKAYGTRRLKQMIEKDIDLANYLAQLIKESTDFELCNNPTLSIVCFRYVGSYNRKKHSNYR